MVGEKSSAKTPHYTLKDYNQIWLQNLPIYYKQIR